MLAQDLFMKLTSMGEKKKAGCILLFMSEITLLWDKQDKPPTVTGPSS